MLLRHNSILLTLCLLAPILPAYAEAGDLAITRVKVFTAPDAVPVEDATIVIRAGRIESIGPGQPPAGMPLLDGAGRTATAGLWNCHVHFTDPALGSGAGLTPEVQGIVRDMLLARGFTSVVDTGSLPATTLAIRAAIDAGSMDGPDIVMAGGSFVYRDGTPSYLPDVRLPELEFPGQAAPAVDAVLDLGIDGIKLFSGSFQANRPPVLLPPDIIDAVSEAAHARGSFVVAHPTSRDGLLNALHGGVDVLAHTAPDAGPLGASLVAQMRAAGLALVPTLKLWSWELRRHGAAEADVAAFQQAGVAQLAEFAAAGGEVLFGTDVGYMSDYDTREEFRMMQRAGMDFEAILRALTTAPAQRFGNGSGRLDVGAPADVVLFRQDPSGDPAAFAAVAYTIRNGRVVHAAP